MPPPSARSKPAEKLLGTSPAMSGVMERVRRVSASDATVLLIGESGVGKEVVARELHAGHPRRSTGPFVAVNCGAIPSTLIESELFGHARGSFTGAEREHQGKFEQAAGGTLFLDEVSTMTAEMQVKLLRALQERSICRVGGAQSIPTDARVVAASNQDLMALVRAGSFRQDLYYRLNVVQVTVPALRERVVDIPLLAQHFVEKCCERAGTPIKRIPEDVMEVLSRHPWPGNVRELENAIEASVVLAGDAPSLDLNDLPAPVLSREDALPESMVRLTHGGMCLRSLVSSLERDLVIQSLQLARGNKAEAARLLGLKRTTFVEKMRRLRLESDGVGAAA